MLESTCKYMYSAVQYNEKHFDDKKMEVCGCKKERERKEREGSYQTGIHTYF